MFFQIETQMKKMVAQIFFLVHTQKFSKNMRTAKNVPAKQSDSFFTKKHLERDYEEIKVKKQVFKNKL